MLKIQNSQIKHRVPYISCLVPVTSDNAVKAGGRHVGLVVVMWFVVVAVEVMQNN